MPTHFQGSPEQRRALDLWIKLARACEAFAFRTSKPIMDAGLTPMQFGVLETLLHLGPLMPSQLAEKHLKSRNNVTVVIDHLERDGLVVRKRCLSDRRAQWIHLTDAGRECIEGVFPKFVDAVVQDSSILTIEEQDQLSALLKKLGKQ